MRGQWESHPQPGTMFNPQISIAMEQKIYNLYENMTDTFTAYRDCEIQLYKDALEVIKGAFETLIEKGLCKFIPKDEYIDEEDCYCYAIKDFSTGNDLYKDLTGVSFVPGEEDVAVYFDNWDVEEGPQMYASQLPTEVFFDIASHLYHEVENL